MTGSERRVLVCGHGVRSFQCGRRLREVGVEVDSAESLWIYEFMFMAQLSCMKGQQKLTSRGRRTENMPVSCDIFALSRSVLLTYLLASEYHFWCIWQLVFGVVHRLKLGGEGISNLVEFCYESIVYPSIGGGAAPT